MGWPNGSKSECWGRVSFYELKSSVPKPVESNFLCLSPESRVQEALYNGYSLSLLYICLMVAWLQEDKPPCSCGTLGGMDSHGRLWSLHPVADRLPALADHHADPGRRAAAVCCAPLPYSRGKGTATHSDRVSRRGALAEPPLPSALSSATLLPVPWPGLGGHSASCVSLTPCGSALPSSCCRKTFLASRVC